MDNFNSKAAKLPQTAYGMSYFSKVFPSAIGRVSITKGQFCVRYIITVFLGGVDLLLGFGFILTQTISVGPFP